MPLHIRIWSGLSYSLCFAMIISDCFLTSTFPPVSVPAQLAVKRYLGASTSVTAWQSFACDLINAAVPHLMEQQHVERPFLGDIDGPHYRGSQSLQMLYLVLESADCLADRIDITFFGQTRPIDGMCAGIHCMYQMCKTGQVPSLFCDDINIVLMPLTVGIFCCLRTNSPIMICSAESTSSTNNRGDGSDKGLPAGPPDCTLHVTCMSVAQHMAVMGSILPPNCST